MSALDQTQPQPRLVGGAGMMVRRSPVLREGSHRSPGSPEKARAGGELCSASPVRKIPTSRALREPRHRPADEARHHEVDGRERSSRVATPQPSAGSFQHNADWGPIRSMAYYVNEVLASPECSPRAKTGRPTR